MRLYPSTDPKSAKYPDRTFYRGAWRTETQIARIRECGREWRRKRCASDPAFRQRESERRRTRYATDTEYRERELKLKREQYARDPLCRLRITQGNRRRAAQKRKETRFAEDQAA